MVPRSRFSDESDAERNPTRTGLRQTGGGDMGRSMTAADTYRRYAAECAKMSEGHQNADFKAMLLEMAAMWLRLADFAEKRENLEDTPD